MILQYKNVEITQGDVVILKNVDLTINEGDYIFITGKVGTGKSSLLSTVYGELRPSKGDACVLDFDLMKLKSKMLPSMRKQMGVVFQSFQLLMDRTVYKNLEFVLKATGWKNKADIKARIEEVLHKVMMENKADKFPHELSGGEQQRIAIARAILNSPKLIVADEPTGNLDIENSQNIVKLLLEIRNEGTAVIISTHNMQLLNLVPDAKIFNCNNGHFRATTASELTRNFSQSEENATISENTAAADEKTTASNENSAVDDKETATIDEKAASIGEETIADNAEITANEEETTADDAKTTAADQESASDEGETANIEGETTADDEDIPATNEDSTSNSK